MDILEKIVVDFYAKATTDILIGYHFRKIQEGPTQSPLYPSLNQFSQHIPRIILFWCGQLNEPVPEKYQELAKSQPQFDILNVHRLLNIRKGELNRWLVLFRETLQMNKDEGNQDLIQKWQDKINQFENVFNEKLF